MDRFVGIGIQRTFITRFCLDKKNKKKTGCGILVEKPQKDDMVQHVSSNESLYLNLHLSHDCILGGVHPIYIKLCFTGTNPIKLGQTWRQKFTITNKLG